MKNQSIVCNIGHFDSEIDIASVQKYQWKTSSRRSIILSSRPVVASLCWHKVAWLIWDAPPAILLCHVQLLHQSGTGTNGTLAERPGVSEKVYVLPKHLDEMVARLHLDKLGANLTKLTDEQARYLNLDKNRRYKPEMYRY